MTFGQILGLGLVYVGIILAMLIIATVMIEWVLWRRRIKRQKELSKPAITQVPINFDRKI